MEGYPGQPPSPLITHFWYPRWNSAQADQQVPGRSRRTASRRRPGQAAHRAVFGRSPLLPDVPSAFVPRNGTWLLVPLHHIFGSEQLSSLAPGIAERAPRPFVGLNPEAARELSVAEGDEVQVKVNEISLSRSSAVSPRPRRTESQAFPWAFTDMPVIVLPAARRSTRYRATGGGVMRQILHAPCVHRRRARRAHLRERRALSGSNAGCSRSGRTGTARTASAPSVFSRWLRT